MRGWNLARGRVCNGRGPCDVMKLGLLYHQFISRGGLEGYLWEFAKQLAGRGHELTLVGSWVEDRFRALAREVRVIPPPPLPSGWMLKKFARRSAAMVPELGCDLTLGFGRTFRQDVHRAGGGCHRVYSRMLPEEKQRRWKNQWELAVEERLYTGGQTRHFVVNASRIAEELQEEYAVPAERISVIHTGVDTEHFQPGDGRESRVELGVGEESRAVVLFVSLDHRRKGLETALGAMELLKDAVLWIVGAELDGEWGRMITEKGLESRVRSFGPQPDLRPFYQAADVFVHPTRYDACANTVLQSMACGLTGVISSRDGARDFIRHGENGFLLSDPRSSEELAAHVQAALDKPQCVAARATMLPLTWAAHVDAWGRVFGDLR